MSFAVVSNIAKALNLNKATIMNASRSSNYTTLLLLVLSVTLSAGLQAATIDWSATAGVPNSFWATGTNWVGGTAPVNDLTTDIAQFNQSSYAAQPSATSAGSINGLIFGNNSTATAAIVMTTGTNLNRLNIGSSGIVMNTQSGTVNVNSSTTQGFQLGASQSWTNNSSSLLTVASISGQTAGQNYVLTINGSGSGGTTIANAIRNDYLEVNSGTVSLVINTTGGVTTLANANTFSGDTTLTSGVLALSNINSLQRSALNTTGTGTVTVSVATLTLGGLKGSRDISSVITSGYGSVTALTLNPLSGTSTYSGVISNGAATTSLSKVGAGTQVLEGANTYTGATNVNAGILGVTSLGNVSVANTLGQSAVTAANLTINGGTLQLTGSTTSTQSTDRLFAVGVSGATLDSSAGAGSSMNFTNTGTITGVNSAGARTLTLTGSRDGSIASIIGQRNGTDSTTSVSKTGNGTWTLSGANTYTGSTTVSGGTLLINGSVGGSGVTVSSGGALGGTGTINTNVLIDGGAHRPGNSPGIQTINGNLAYNNGSTVQWELADSTTTNQPNPSAVFDTVIVNGDLNFAGTTTLSLSMVLTGDGGMVDWGDTLWQGSLVGTNGWLLYDVSGTTTNFGNLGLSYAGLTDADGTAFATALPGAGFSLFQSGNDIYLNYSAIPEPGTYAMLLGGLGLLIYLRRKKS